MPPESALIVELLLSSLRLPRQRSAQPRRSRTETIEPLHRRLATRVSEARSRGEAALRA
jgi:hypothetical protein